MAKQLGAHSPPIPVAAVDATVSKALAKRYEVTGFPTVFAFRGTTAVHYDDEKKNTADMVQYMREEHPAKVMGPGLRYQGPTPLPSKKHLDKFLEIKAYTKPAVVAFIPAGGDGEGGKGEEEEEDAEAAAVGGYGMVHYGLREKFEFGIVRSSDAMAELQATAGEIRVYKAGAYYAKKFEQRYHSKLVEDGNWGDVHALKQEILGNCLPLLGEMHAESQEHYLFHPDKPLLLFYTNVNFDHKEGKYYKETRNLAKQLRGILAPYKDDGSNLMFALGDKTAAAKSLEALGFPTGADKIATIQNGTMKFKFTGASTAHFKTRLNEFVGGFVEGTLTPFYRSAEGPCCGVEEALKEGAERGHGVGVMELIGKTAQEFILGGETGGNPSHKDTLIMIYAVGCPHCSALKPYYEEVAGFIAEHSALSDVLQLATVNGATNDVPIPGVTIPGFPALFYVDGRAGKDGVAVHIDTAPPPSGYGKLVSSLLKAIADQPRIRDDHTGLRELLEERLTIALQAEEAAAAEEADAEAAFAVGEGSEDEEEGGEGMEEVTLADDDDKDL